MKKKYIWLLIDSAVAACLFLAAGCNNFAKHGFTIENISSADVRFSIAGYGNFVHSLKKQERLYLDLYANPHFIFEDNPRVIYSSGKDRAVIRDMPAWSCTLVNNMNVEICVAELHNLAGIYGERFCVPAASGTQAGRKPVTVYTDKPEFRDVNSGGDMLEGCSITAEVGGRIN